MIPHIIIAQASADYYNFSFIEQEKERISREFPQHVEDAWEFKVPTGHDAWHVAWFIYAGPSYACGHGVAVDAETGNIIDEWSGICWG